MAQENDDGSTSSKDGPARPGNGRAAGAQDAARGDEASAEIGDDIVAFLLDDLGRLGDDRAPAGALERLRERTFAGGQLVRRVGFARARPYLLKLRDYRRCVMRLCEVPEAPLD